VLLETVLSKTKSFVPKKDRFETLKYKMIQDLTNFGYNVPYFQIGTHMSVIMNEKTYTHEERVKVLQNHVDFEGFSTFCSKVWELGLFGEALIQGNFSYEKASGISSSIDSEFKDVRAIGASKDDIDNVIRLQSHVLKSGETVRVEMDLKDEKNVNSCIEYYIQIENSLSNIRQRTLTDLLETIMHEPCFSQLRTREQLGYVVFSGVRLSRTAIGFRILVQSERLTSYLEYRIEEFLKRFAVYVNDLTVEQFDGFKQALKDKKLTKLKNLSEEVSRFWEAIADGYYDFEAKAKHADELEKITHQEFVEFFRHFIHPESKVASRTIFHLKSQTVPPVAPTKLVQCALNNFLYSEGIQVESEKIEDLLEGENDTNSIADKVLKYLVENSLVQTQEAVRGKLALVLENAIDKPQPSIYPRGELKTLQQYRSSHPLGGLPTPVAPLKEFYYPSLEHL
jgi:insulysin